MFRERVHRLTVYTLFEDTSKGPKISVTERRTWLESYENGARIDTLAKDVGRAERTVKDHIDKARRERVVDRAEREQLKEALGAHQQDLLGLVQRLRDTVYTPPLQLASGIRPEYPEAFLGLESVCPTLYILARDYPTRLPRSFRKRGRTQDQYAP